MTSLLRRQLHSILIVTRPLVLKNLTRQIVKGRRVVPEGETGAAAR
jgi:hypothetical protein